MLKITDLLEEIAGNHETISTSSEKCHFHMVFQLQRSDNNHKKGNAI